MPDLPPLHARVKITAGGYAGDFATVTDVYTRWDNIKVVEVKTDSGMPLILGPLHLEILPPRMIETASGIVHPLFVVAPSPAVEVVALAE